MTKKYKDTAEEKLSNFLSDENTRINIRRLFKEIYYHLYTNSKIPRAERLVAEVIKLIFCKIYDETAGNKEFSLRADEDDNAPYKRIIQLFEAVKSKYSDVFDPADRLLLDATSLRYIMTRLQKVNLTKLDVDAVGEAFQELVGPSLRGEKGQFFTPRVLTRTMISLLRPSAEDRILDPACGTGGFLISALKYLIESTNNQIPASNLTQNLYGIDKEIDQAKYSKTYMTILGDERANIFCEDSLDPDSWNEETKKTIKDEAFEIVVTNPPFGANIPVEDRKILQRYDLGHKWIRRKGLWRITDEVLNKQDPQILFLERCLQFCKTGGKVAIVLPEGPFCNLGQGFIFEFIRLRASILAIIDCPRVLFQPSTDTKTNVLILQKGDVCNKKVFMSVVKKCGHDKRGQPVYRTDGQLDDEFPEVVERFSKKDVFAASRLAFWQEPDEIYVPRYYDPEISKDLEEMRKSGQFKMMTVQSLIDEGVLSICRGVEVGYSYYGSGDIPFIRTSDIANWEISHDPTFSVSEQVYQKVKSRIDLKPLDILFVNDGRYLIGNLAILSKDDTRIIVQSHIRIIRVMKPEVISPHLLLYMLNNKIVKRQIETKTFVQSTIATLGSRLKEIVLPIPKDRSTRDNIEKEIREILDMRSELRKRMRSFTNQ
jgi:type I restriction enzyme M protein